MSQTLKGLIRIEIENEKLLCSSRILFLRVKEITVKSINYILVFQLAMFFTIESEAIGDIMKGSWTIDRISKCCDFCCHIRATLFSMILRKMSQDCKDIKTSLVAGQSRFG